MTKYLLPFYKLPRVWRYFLTYIGKGLIFLCGVVISMLVLDLVLEYFSVPKDLRTPIWFAVYFGGLGLWFMWDEAKRKVDLENIKLLNTIDKGK